MTGADIALVIGQVAVLITSISGALVSLRNSRKIDQVHETTNSLAQRNETIAKELGRREGKEAEKANPSP
jgi:uncharacterized membrane protein